MIDAIQKLMERETAGDPISGLKWTRKTTDKIARQLRRLGITAGRNTVGRLLRQMKYSLRTNRKRISAGSTSDRDRQFRYLCRQRNRFEKRGDPVLSVDAKKRELMGNFKNPGVKWDLNPAHSASAEAAKRRVWRQSDNVLFEQSRNVLLTAPSFGDAGRTTTDDAGGSRPAGDFKKGKEEADQAA